MNIRNLQATALKGQSFSMALGALTMITGPNDKGKSARADALRLLLLGHLPEHGKTNASTFALSSGSKLSVEGDIEGFGLVTREWRQHGKSIRATSTGADSLPETPLVTMDANEYFAKADAGRVQMLWELLHVEHGEKWTPTAVQDRVVKAMGEMSADLRKNVVSMFVAGEGDTVQTVMERASTWLGEEASRINAEINRWEKTAQGITQAGLQDQPVDPARIESDRAEATRKLEELVADQARLAEIVRGQNSTAQRVREISGQVAELRANLGSRALPTESRQELEKRVAAAMDALATARQENRTRQSAIDLFREGQRQRFSLTEAADKLDQFQAAFETVQGSLEEITQALEILPAVDMDALNNAVIAAHRRSSDVKAKQDANDKAQADLRARTDELLKTKCCPTCGAKGGEFQETVNEIFGRRINDLQGEASLIAEEFRTVAADVAQAEQAQNRGAEKMRRGQALERQKGALLPAVAEARQKVQTAKQAKGQLETMPALVEPSAEATDLTELETALAGARDDVRRLGLNEQLAQALQSLEALQTSGGQEDAAERHASIEDDIAAQRARLEELAGEQQKAANQLADRKRVAQAGEQKEKCEAEGKAVAAGRKELAQARAEMIKETFGPLLDVANKFTQGILPTPLEYRDGEIGRFNGGSFVPVTCFGGTHKAVTYAGLQAALGASAPAKLVIMDEMGRFDSANKLRFLQNVAAAVKDRTIEQFVGIDVDPRPYKAIAPNVLEGLTLIELGS